MREMGKSAQPGLKKAARKRKRLTRLAAAGAEEFSGEGLEEIAPPDANDQSGAEEEHSVQAGAAFAGPIGTVFEIEPQRELVEGESSTDTVEQGHQAAGENRRGLGSRAHFDKPAEPHDQQQENPPDQMMDVGAANVNVVKRANVAPGGVGHGACQAQSKKETDRGK